MSKLVSRPQDDDWQDIKLFCAENNVTKRMIYHRIHEKDWYPGFVIDKNCKGRITKGNTKHFKQFEKGLKK